MFSSSMCTQHVPQWCLGSSQSQSLSSGPCLSCASPSCESHSWTWSEVPIRNTFKGKHHLVASRKSRYMMNLPSGSMPWVIGKKVMEFSTVQMTTSKLGYPIWAKKMSNPGLFWNLHPCLWLQSELTRRPVISRTIVYFGWWYGGSNGSGKSLSLNGSSIAFFVVKILFFSLL